MILTGVECMQNDHDDQILSDQIRCLPPPGMPISSKLIYETSI